MISNNSSFWAPTFPVLHHVINVVQWILNLNLEQNFTLYPKNKLALKKRCTFKKRFFVKKEWRKVGFNCRNTEGGCGWWFMETSGFCLDISGRRNILILKGRISLKYYFCFPGNLWVFYAAPDWHFFPAVIMQLIFMPIKIK